MFKNLITLFLIFLLIASGIYSLVKKNQKQTTAKQPVDPVKNSSIDFPLSIEYMRQQKYPGSNLTIEQTLADGVNYHQYIASYQSQGLKIYGLLTVPSAKAPAGGYPAIIFNHGYIPPEQYVTTERYVAYVAAFARNGYVVFKPDYRGHGNSEGQPEGAYYSPAYAVDDLNAIASIKKYPGVNPTKIGVWGHSLGGNISLRDLVIDPKDIKAAVIWSGVVGTYNQLLTQWHRARPFQPSSREIAGHVTSIRQHLQNKHGTPDTNPSFWHSIDPRYYINDIKAPVQLHVGEADEEVPPLFSESLASDLKKAGKTVEIYSYPGADHNISGPSFELAMQRSIEFFDKYLK